MRESVAIVASIVTILLMAQAESLGAERMGRQISDIPGMPEGIWDIGQDSTGYLWLASIDGLSRYDGYEIRPWGSEDMRTWMRFLSTGPDGRVLAGNRSTGLFEVDGSELRRLLAPEDSTDPGPYHAVYDRDGVLWAAWGGRLFQRTGDSWLAVESPDIERQLAYRLAPRDAGGILVGTNGGSIFSVTPDGNLQRLAEGLGGRINRLIDDPGGAVAIVRFGERPGLVRVTPGGVERLLGEGSRSEGLVRRARAYWAAHDNGVWVVGDDGSREFLSSNEGVTGGGTIRLDREGGLWMTSVRGLVHFPEPDTRIWTEASGLPHALLRRIFPVSGGYLLTTWLGPLLVGNRGDDVQAVDLRGLFSRDAGCRDPWGGVWFKAFPEPHESQRFSGRPPKSAMLVEWRDGKTIIRRTADWWQGDISCDEGDDGSHWVLTGDELWRIASRGGQLERRGALPPDAVRNLASGGLAVSPDGRSAVVVFESGTVCEAALPDGDRQVLHEEDWACNGLTSVFTVTDLLETRSGRLWMSSAGSGVLERAPDGWRRVGGELAGLDAALGLDLSPRGGVWVVGWRERLRVEETDSGPVVVERLGTAHGVPEWQNGYGLLEEQDGTVWLPLFSGLVRVPPDARRQRLAPPSVTLTRLVADGRQVEAGEPIELRHGGHWLEVRWSALSFRDPTRVRYRMRLDSGDDWTVLNQPFVRLAGLSSGRHRLELGASLDGKTWSDAPAIVVFEVRTAWYAQPWFLLLATAAALALLYAVYRLRMAHLLRLERQRTRIAMDLHDEMGAGLGSAGLLIGLLGEGDLDDEERRRLGSRAEEQIKDLGGSLADIVWSLRPGTGTLDALLLFLRQRAADLFPAGCGTRVSFDAPDPCPVLPLDLALRRNLQWIAVEALHNAARHAEARRVVVTLRPEGGEFWVLLVRDDGRGLPGENESAGGSGLGQESMRRRASEIGADLRVRSAPGEGTDVEIRFRLGKRRT